jgi:hypothetical protein
VGQLVEDIMHGFVGEVDKGEGTCEWEVVMRVYFDVSEAEELC